MESQPLVTETRKRAALAVSIEDLPDNVIQLIADQFIWSRERRTVLPLMNKRWARALRGPSHAWRSVSIGMLYDGVERTRQDAPKQLDSATVLAWFTSRPGCVKELLIGTFDARARPQLSSVIFGAVISSQASSIRAMVLRMDASDFTGADSAILRACTGLRSLDIFVKGVHEQRGIELIKTLAGLSALTRLKLKAFTNGGLTWFRCNELAHLRSTSLRNLSVVVDQVDEGLLRMCLPALHTAKITRFEGEGLRFDRDSFSMAGKLESLSLTGHGDLTCTPDCFAGLTRLTSLELEACCFAGIPTALTALKGSLTSLALPLNNDLQLTHEDVKVVLALRKLRRLDLRKWSVKSVMNRLAVQMLGTHLPYDPAPWTLRSLQHLVTLPNAFLAQHGHALALQMHNDGVEDEFDSSEEEDERYHSDEGGSNAAG